MTAAILASIRGIGGETGAFRADPRIRSRRCWWWRVAVGLLAIACTGGPDADPAVHEYLQRETGENFVVFSFDALRADHLGAYGYARRTSPNIDAFANRALVFDRAWSAAQATPTSFASAFTGRYPSRVFRKWQLASVSTLAGTLSGLGYSTAFYSNSVQLVPERGFDRGFSEYRIVVDENGGLVDDAVVLDAALRWLRTVTSPFFVWVHILSPHAPYVARPEASHLYDTAYEGRFESTTGFEFTATSPVEDARIVDLYDAGIFYGDSLFGRFLSSLEKQELADSTWVIVTADHGEELMGHGRMQHEQVFDEVLHIPLIVRRPRSSQPRRSDAPVSNLDLLPTLAELAGGAFDDQIDGRSWLRPLNPRRVRMAMAMTAAADDQIAVLQGSRKAILRCADGWKALFDLTEDPHESRNLLPALRANFDAMLVRATGVLEAPPCRAMSDARHGVAPETALSPETVRGLEALGYLGPTNSMSETGDRIWLEPNPVRTCNELSDGPVEVHWDASRESPHALEIRVENPDGPLLAIVGVEGAVLTGPWVRDGMKFYLVDPPTGRTLASTTAVLPTGRCR